MPPIIDEPRAKTVFLDETVYDAALRRIRWVFENHDHVGVNYSGGKDSTVVLHLALKVARELGRVPLDVLFIDQEAEWQAVIDHMRVVRDLPDVRLHWYQVPMRISNASSASQQWLHCWAEDEEWMRPKEPDSIHENDLGTTTFKDMFGAWQLKHFKGRSAAQLAGVRAEESPARRMGLTTYETWRGQTWGTRVSPAREHFTWYPIYDWRLSDVWHAIESNGWPYCRLYDQFYRHGMSARQMRVSSLHHETAIRSLFILQEIEPETWDALSARIAGVNTARHLDWAGFVVNELPPMFRDWQEYRDYLLENVITDPDQRARMRRQFFLLDRRYRHDPDHFEKLLRTEIKCILVGDDHRTAISVFEAASIGKSKNRGARSGRVN